MLCRILTDIPVKTTIPFKAIDEWLNSSIFDTEILPQPSKILKEKKWENS